MTSAIALPRRAEFASSPRTGPDYSQIGVRGVIGRFYRRMEDVLGRSWAPQVGMMVPSNQEIETYPALGMVPQLRTWRGGRLLKALRTDQITVRNEPFESSLAVDRLDLRRDKTGQLNIRLGELARRAGTHWELLTTNLIETNGTAYDGQTFFSATHQLGNSPTQSNQLTAATIGSLNVATATDPTEDEMVDAILAVIQQAYTYQDDQAEPINGDAMRWAIMVSPNLMKATLAAIRSRLRKQGSDSALPLQDFEVVPVVNPRLTTNTVFYAFRLDTEMKPFILQSEVDLTTEVLGEGSDSAFFLRQLVWGTFASRQVAYGEPLHAIRATLS